MKDKSQTAALIARVLLGVWFVYSGGMKIFGTGLDRFTRDVANYQLVKPPLDAVAAYTVPWLELIAGLCLMNNVWPETRILITTGRISSEMLQKAARMKVPILISRTSPSSLSIEMAERYGITLIGYARRHRFNVYSNPQRVELTEMQG